MVLLETVSALLCLFIYNFQTFFTLLYLHFAPTGQNAISVVKYTQKKVAQFGLFSAQEGDTRLKVVPIDFSPPLTPMLTKLFLTYLPPFASYLRIFAKITTFSKIFHKKFFLFGPCSVCEDLKKNRRLDPPIRF